MYYSFLLSAKQWNRNEQWSQPWIHLLKSHSLKKMQHSQLEIAKISNRIISFTQFSFQLQRQRLPLHSLRRVKALSNRHHCTPSFFQGISACVTMLGKRFCYIMFISLRNCHCCKKVPQEAKKWVMTLILHWFYREDVWTLQ